MLEAAGLQCDRGSRTLFRGLDVGVRQKDLVRIAGANGSGKTSLLRILCGLRAPDAGEVRWKGEPIRTLREDYSRQIVYLGHAPAVKDDLTVAENLRFACLNAGISSVAIGDAIEKLGVQPDVPVRKLSQGQRRRAALARLALSSSVPLWLLDEPFTALDRAATALVEGLIAAHAAAGGAVVYTTHQDARLQATREVNLDA